MTEKDSSLTRRKFIAAGSAAIAAPLVMSMAGKVMEANAADKTEAASDKKKKYVVTDVCCLCPPLRCKLFCPAGAYYFNGMHMAIDQEKCIQCGTCYKICPCSAVADVSAPVPAVVPHDTITKECDFLVIGGGMSGIVAAAAAADMSKKKVIVLERNKKAGGCGYFPIGTGLQKGGGMGPGGGMGGGMGGQGGGQSSGASTATTKSAQETLDDSVAQAMSGSENLLNPKLIANFKIAQSALQEWLYSWADTDNIFGNMEKERSGRFINAIIDKAKAAGVEILTETSAVDFIVNGDGQITGVKAKDAGGSVVVNFKYCLVSTGTVVNNTSIMTRSAVPEYTNPWDIRTGHRYPYNTGDGVLMAEKAGIPIDWANIFIHFTGVNSSLAESTTRILDNKADSLIVNLNGERWVNETLLTDDFLPALLKQPRNMLWHIMDSNIIQSGVGKVSSGSSGMMGMMGGMGGGMSGGPGGGMGGGQGGAQGGMGGGQGGAQGGMGGGQGGAQGGMAGAAAGMTATAAGSQNSSKNSKSGSSESQGFSQDKVKDMAEFSYAPTADKPDMKDVERIAALPGRHICKANTLEELADKMGVNKKVLLASVKRYNELCAKGHDDDFFKSKKYMVAIEKAPFYSSSHFLGHDGAFGGLNINENGQVMGKNGPIPNLFASGDITSSNTVHHGSKRGGGISAEAGWAVCSGWLAADYVSKKLKKA
jgi:succinate dehydrogenase/fumarate reductase flavoprotein subunit/ferredoxin-like protein FixX